MFKKKFKLCVVIFNNWSVNKSVYWRSFLKPSLLFESPDLSCSTSDSPLVGSQVVLTSVSEFGVLSSH